MPSQPPAAHGTAGEYFAAMVESYDSLIRRAVPRYEEMTQRLIHYLPPKATRVLELGCGTGNLSLALAQRYPYARFTFVDAASEMLDVTRQRLDELSAPMAGTARFIAARFEELSPEPGEFDLVTSSISLHHVAVKETLFRTIRQALSSGGLLCFSDQMRAAPPANHERNWEEWLAYCRQPGNCTEEEVESLVAHAAAHDHYETPAEHLRMLHAAGFRDADCLWRNGMWTIITATA